MAMVKIITGCQREENVRECKEEDQTRGMCFVNINYGNQLINIYSKSFIQKNKTTKICLVSYKSCPAVSASLIFIPSDRHCIETQGLAPVKNIVDNTIF